MDFEQQRNCYSATTHPASDKNKLSNPFPNDNNLTSIDQNFKDFSKQWIMIWNSIEQRHSCLSSFVWSVFICYRISNSNRVSAFASLPFLIIIVHDSCRSAGDCVTQVEVFCETNMSQRAGWWKRLAASEILMTSTTTQSGRDARHEHKRRATYVSIKCERVWH